VDIRSLLNGLNPHTLQSLNRMMNTPEGRALMERLKKMDKNEIMREAEAAGLANMSKDELIRQLTQNPQLIKQLNNLLDRK